MKQIYSIFISAALLLNVGLTSCDSFLTETPQGELTEANAFTSIKDAEALIISCYDGIQKGHEEYYMWYYMILADIKEKLLGSISLMLMPQSGQAKL